MEYVETINHNQQFAKLVKAIRLGVRFSLLLVEVNLDTYRDRLIKRLNTSFKNSTVIEASTEKFHDFDRFESHLSDMSKDFSVIHVVTPGGETYKENWPDFFKGWNYHRDQIAAACPVTIILWLTPTDFREFPAAAPDAWSWRNQMLSLALPEKAFVTVIEEKNIATRINELLEYMKNHPENRDETNVFFYRELGELYFRLAEFGSAQKYLSMAIEIYEKQGDATTAAQTAVILKNASGISID